MKDILPTSSKMTAHCAETEFGSQGRGAIVRSMLETSRLVTAAALVCLLCLAAPFPARAQDSPPVGQGFVVEDKFGGEILGYDVDRDGTEGMLSEYVLLQDGNLLIATETFDQKTGKILKVVEKKTETQDNFVTWGVVNSLLL